MLLAEAMAGEKAIAAWRCARCIWRDFGIIWAGAIWCLAARRWKKLASIIAARWSAARARNAANSRPYFRPTSRCFRSAAGMEIARSGSRDGGILRRASHGNQEPCGIAS